MKYIIVVFLLFCGLQACDIKTSRPVALETNGLNSYIAPIWNLYNQISDDTLTLENLGDYWSYDGHRPPIAYDPNSYSWPKIRFDIKYYLETKESVLAKLDSIPNSKHKFSYENIRSILLHGGTLTKNYVINQLGEPHEFPSMITPPDEISEWNPYPYRMLELDSTLSSVKTLDIFDIHHPRPPRINSFRYYVYGPINKKPKSHDLYFVDFIINDADKLIAVRTCKFAFNRRCIWYHQTWYVE